MTREELAETVLLAVDREWRACKYAPKPNVYDRLIQSVLSPNGGRIHFFTVFLMR